MRKAVYEVALDAVALVLPLRVAKVIGREIGGCPKAWLGSEKLVRRYDKCMGDIGSKSLATEGLDGDGSKAPVADDIREIEGEVALSVGVNIAVIRLAGTEDLELHSSVIEIRLLAFGVGFARGDVSEVHEVTLHGLTESVDGVATELHVAGD